MKTWVNAEIIELDIRKTEQNIFGFYYDGGYIGDGQVGLLTFKKPGKNPDPTPIPNPGETDPLS